MRRLARRAIAVLGALLVLGTPQAGGIVAPRAALAYGPTVIGPSDWPTFGRTVHRDFDGVTTLTPKSVRTLARAWFFKTGAAVTANPILVAGTVYVGSWDGRFYAIDARTGRERWQHTLKLQPAVFPVPGHFQPGDIESDGGIVTSSAFFEPGDSTRPDLVIFGGGFTLYALRAADGALYWEHDYTGRPDLPPDPAHDGSRIFSSPAVVGNQVLFSVSADGAFGKRGYLASADLATGDPQWIREIDVDGGGRVLNDGCGGVWSSPTVVEALGLEVVGVADCVFKAVPPYNERVLGVRIADGTIAWVFTPPRLRNGDPACDFDFGATANLGTAADGTPTFLGIGGKDGTYYSIDPATGSLRWQRNVVFGGYSGGFVATTAYDGSRVYGATALGEVGRGAQCEPANPHDQQVQEPSLHAIWAGRGNVAWQRYPMLYSFAPTTVAGGMVFSAPMLLDEVQIRDAATGQLLAVLQSEATTDGGITVAGDAVIFGTGSSEQARPDGVGAWTPQGLPPRLP